MCPLSASLPEISLFSFLDNSTVKHILFLYFFLRKEVIQPHLPIRLPCYDFTPVIGPAFDYTKLESLVIADQNAAVNTFPGLVHTARHTMGVSNARSQ